MALRDWLQKEDAKVLAPLGLLAAVAGATSALWLQLPAYLSEPVIKPFPRPVTAEDPGRARYQEVIASLGGIGATYTPRAFFRPPPLDLAEAEAGPYEVGLFDDPAYDSEREARRTRRPRGGYGEAYLFPDALAAEQEIEHRPRQEAPPSRRGSNTYAREDQFSRPYAYVAAGGYVYAAPVYQPARPASEPYVSPPYPGGYAYAEPAYRAPPRPPTQPWADAPLPPPPPRPEAVLSGPMFFE